MGSQRVGHDCDFHMDYASWHIKFITYWFRWAHLGNWIKGSLVWWEEKRKMPGLLGWAGAGGGGALLAVPCWASIPQGAGFGEFTGIWNMSTHAKAVSAVGFWAQPLDLISSSPWEAPWPPLARCCTKPHPVWALLPPRDSNPGNEPQKLSLRPTWSPAPGSTDWGVFFQRDVEAGIPPLLQEPEITVQKISSFSALYLAQSVPSLGLASFTPGQRGILGGKSVTI